MGRHLCVHTVVYTTVTVRQSEHIIHVAKLTLPSAKNNYMDHVTDMTELAEKHLCSRIFWTLLSFFVLFLDLLLQPCSSIYTNIGTMIMIA